MGDSENSIYQTALTFIADISLNLTAVKVTEHTDDFLGWCNKLHQICKQEINMDLIEDKQLPILKKLQDTLETGISLTQLKMLRIAPWPIFANIIEDLNALQSIDERLALLKHINTIKAQPLTEMVEEDLLAFAGKHSVKHDPSIYNFDVEWFASTKAANSFHAMLKAQPQDFQQALEFIPLEGDVTALHYQAFVAQYKNIFNLNDEKAPLMPATRLLAMRRPDVFIALTNQKLSVLCQGLNIAKFNNQDFDAYFNDMIHALSTFAWHRAPAPTVENELVLWQNRVALVDVFLFADDLQAQKSNYIRLRDKPKSTKVGVARSPKAGMRTKESAEMLVDKALSGEDIPEYLLEMRSTLVNSVKDGKTVEQAIGLMRTIFG